MMNISFGRFTPVYEDTYYSALACARAVGYTLSYPLRLSLFLSLYIFHKRIIDTFWKPFWTKQVLQGDHIVSLAISCQDKAMAIIVDYKYKPVDNIIR